MDHPTLQCGNSNSPTLDEAGVVFAAEVFDIEERFLAAGIHDPANMHDAAVRHGLSSESFGDPHHRLLFAALCLSAEHGFRPSIDELREWARDEGITFPRSCCATCDHGAGCDSLHRLWHLEIVPTGLERYAAQIADFARRRDTAHEYLRRAGEVIVGDTDQFEIIVRRKGDALPPRESPNNLYIPKRLRQRKPAYKRKGTRIRG